MLVVIDPGLQEYVNKPVPPEAFELIAPLQFPKQFTFVWVGAIIISRGLVKVIVPVFEQPNWSWTKTVYVPAHKLVAVCEVCEGVVADHV